jgi:hypothetical protein
VVGIAGACSSGGPRQHLKSVRPLTKLNSHTLSGRARRRGLEELLVPKLREKVGAQSGASQYAQSKHCAVLSAEQWVVALRREQQHGAQRTRSGGGGWSDSSNSNRRGGSV